MSFVDIRKAYFNGIPERAVFMHLPKEMGMPTGMVARQVRCVYGTRDAGKIWEDTYTQVLESMGFASGQGEANPCIFYHKTRDISIFVHGDDFTALGMMSISIGMRQRSRTVSRSRYGDASVKAAPGLNKSESLIALSLWMTKG